MVSDAVTSSCFAPHYKLVEEVQYRKIICKFNNLQCTDKGNMWEFSFFWHSFSVALDLKKKRNKKQQVN